MRIGDKNDSEDRQTARNTDVRLCSCTDDTKTSVCPSNCDMGKQALPYVKCRTALDVWCVRIPTFRSTYGSYHAHAARNEGVDAGAFLWPCHHNQKVMMNQFSDFVTCVEFNTYST
jgi:hypothetical protein